MAYGDTTITYPIFEPRISQGTTGTNVIYSMTVLSGPARVGQAGTFVFRMDWVDVEYDFSDTFIFHNINASFYFTQDYLDYRGNSTRRVYMPGALYAPGSGSGRNSSYTYNFVVGDGWKHIELANQQFGTQYDPTPFGAYTNGILRLWNGATFSVTAEGQVHETTDYALINTTGVDAVTFSIGGSDATFQVEVNNASGASIGDSAVYRYYTQDFFEGTTDGNRPLRYDAPGPTNRAYSVTVIGTTGRRRGSYLATWYFGTPPTAPPDTGGGGLQVNHGGVGIATGVTTGALRASQSAMHQHFVRAGSLTSLTSTTPAGSSGSGVVNG